MPLYTYLQVSCEGTERSRVIAANNIVSAIAMIGGSAIVLLMMTLKMTIATVFLVIALCNAVVAVVFWFTARIVIHRTTSLC